MNPQTMQVEIIAPNKVVAKVAAGKVSVPAHWGYMQILPLHSPYITELETGVLTVSDIEGGKPDLKLFVSGGFLQVDNERLVILADIVEKPTEIDRTRAQASLTRAQERLKKLHNGEVVDYERAAAALGRAQKRLEFMDMLGEAGHPYS